MYCIFALFVTCFCALLDWFAGYLFTMESGGSSQKSKFKGQVDYDYSQFTGKVEEKLYNKVWVRNGAVIERKLNLVALENAGIRWVQNFTTRRWINLTRFKAELILTLCQEFMANIKHNLETEKGQREAV